MRLASLLPLFGLLAAASAQELLEESADVRLNPREFVENAKQMVASVMGDEMAAKKFEEEVDKIGTPEFAAQLELALTQMGVTNPEELSRIRYLLSDERQLDAFKKMFSDPKLMGEAMERFAQHHGRDERAADVSNLKTVQKLLDEGYSVEDIRNGRVKGKRRAKRSDGAGGDGGAARKKHGKKKQARGASGA